MALTALQRRVCLLLADERKRSGESYVAGDVALNEVVAGARRSRDIDLFHDTEAALVATWRTIARRSRPLPSAWRPFGSCRRSNRRSGMSSRAPVSAKGLPRSFASSARAARSRGRGRAHASESPHSTLPLSSPVGFALGLLGEGRIVPGAGPPRRSSPPRPPDFGRRTSAISPDRCHVVAILDLARSLVAGPGGTVFLPNFTVRY